MWWKGECRASVQAEGIAEAKAVRWERTWLVQELEECDQSLLSWREHDVRLGCREAGTRSFSPF